MPIPKPPKPTRKRLSVQEELATQHRKIRFGEKLPIAKEDATIGKLYRGWAYFEGKGKQRCVIKKIESSSDFAKVAKISMRKKGLSSTMENLAELYNSTIEDLRNAGIPLPKMKAVVLDGDLLVLSQYFINASKMKLSTYYMRNYSAKELEELIDIWVKTINAGYFPPSDFIEKKTVGDGGFVPLDIDFLVLQRLLPEQTIEANILFFCDWIRVFLGDDRKLVFDSLLSKITNPKMHQLFAETINRF